MAQKFTVSGHRMDFNDDQIPYRIVSIKKPQNHKIESYSSKKTSGVIYVKLMKTKSLFLHIVFCGTVPVIDIKIRSSNLKMK